MRGPTVQSTASPHRHLVGCDGWGSRLTIYIANSPIIIDHHRFTNMFMKWWYDVIWSPTLREAIDFSIISHFQMASPGLSLLAAVEQPICISSSTLTVHIDLIRHFTNLSLGMCSARPIDIINNVTERWKGWNDKIATDCPSNQHKVVACALTEHLFGQQHISMCVELGFSFNVFLYLFHCFC